MEDLLSGVPASNLFRTLQQKKPLIDARELGQILMIEFPRISPAASLSIRKWFRHSEDYDFPDEQIDGLILHYLNEAKYVIADVSPESSIKRIP